MAVPKPTKKISLDDLSAAIVFLAFGAGGVGACCAMLFGLSTAISGAYLGAGLGTALWSLSLRKEFYGVTGVACVILATAMVDGTKIAGSWLAAVIIGAAGAWYIVPYVKANCDKTQNLQRTRRRLA